MQNASFINLSGFSLRTLRFGLQEIHVEGAVWVGNKGALVEK